jgi:chromosome segregation ATPase
MIRTSKSRAKNAAVSEDLARTESQLRAIEVDLGTLNDRLAKAKTKTNVERNRLAALRKEIDELAGDIDRERLTFIDDSGTRRVKELERRKRELQEQIEQFLLAS